MSSAVSRHRDAALCPLAQTAGFRSDAASDRAARLYIVNRDEVMCKAESARQLQRRSGNSVSAIVSMESRPTSPAPCSSELSSLRSLQLSSSFRGDVRPDSAIVNPCSQRAGRQALLPLNNAGACVYGATSTGISGPVRVIAPAQFRGGRPPLNELTADSHWYTS